MKKFFKVIIPIIMVVAIALLSVSLYHTRTELKAAKADLEGLCLIEGKVVESTSGEGGTVTLSLKNAVYYTNDNFITQKRVVGCNVKDIFCELHKRGFLLLIYHA